MLVEFDVFSGGPNPCWELSPEESAALADQLRDLPPAGKPIEEGGLGYRGFLLSTRQDRPGLPDRVRVYNGVIAIEQGGTVRTVRDAKGIERWLLQQAARQGYQAASNVITGS